MSTLLLIRGGNHTAAGHGGGLDFPGGGKGHLGQNGSNQLIDQHGEQSDVADDGALRVHRQGQEAVFQPGAAG